MYEAIHQDLRNGDPAAAELKARAILADRPRDSEAYRVLAAAQAMAGNRTGARDTIETGLQTLPNDAALNFARATMLLDDNEIPRANEALSQTIKLDPNFFPAYVLQSQLALAQGQVDEAERLTRIAHRVSPDHPQLHTIEGQVALARQDFDRALQFLSAAQQQMPGDERVLRSLGMAYMGKGHYAFAEQTFRSLLAKEPNALDVRGMLVDAVRLQGRSAEALELVEPLLGDNAAPTLLINAGIIAMEAGDQVKGVNYLERGVDLEPENPQALAALVQAWQATEQLDHGRVVLEGKIAAHPENSNFWQARLAMEEFAGDAAKDIIERWMAAAPNALEPLQARIVVHDVRGERAEADVLAEKMIALNPLHLDAQLRLLDSLMAKDKDAAIERITSLQELFKDKDQQVDQQLRAVRSGVMDRAGRYQEAVDIWLEVQREGNPYRLPLPPVGHRREADAWPALKEDNGLDTANEVIGNHHQLLWGPPGSQSAFVGYSLSNSNVPVLTDRFTATPPDDMLQRFAGINLLDGEAEKKPSDTEKSQLAAEWLSGLTKRGVPQGAAAVDALLFWDNNYLDVLRANPSHAQLLLAIRDPRDMFLHWLAYANEAPFQFESLEAAATWFNDQCVQIADIVEQNLFPHRLIKLDDAVSDELALQTELTTAFGMPVAALPEGFVQHKQFAKGHWREYAGVLGSVFDTLKDVSVRLGYSEA